MSTHMPGPWAVELDAPNDGDISIVAYPDAPPYEWVFVAEVDCRSDPDDPQDLEPPRETAIANAHLIAAAPDLLAVVREWFDPENPNRGLFGDQAGTEAAMARARAALSKALGEGQ